MNAVMKIKFTWIFRKAISKIMPHITIIYSVM